MANTGQLLAALAPLVGRTGAAGIVGNLQQESSLRSNAPGGHLAQWQGAREVGLERYAGARGLSPNDDQANIGYLIQDLQGPYKGLTHQLRAARTPQQAADLFSAIYERPGIPMLANRERYAAQAAGAPASGTFNIPKVDGMRPATAGNAQVATQIGGGVDHQALNEAVFRALANRPIDTSGRVSTANPLKTYLAAEQSGQFNAPTMHAQDTLTANQGPLGGTLTSDSLHHITSNAGNLNPLGHGWAIGRTDQGVDAHAAPGTPIHAINDSVVREVVPNWYAGQPLVLMQLTAGPDKGKYWYVSEQITHAAHVGQVVRRGDVVAQYAPTGTGIEIGWGSPHSGSRTLAGATTGYHEGDVTPAGQDFARRILGG